MRLERGGKAIAATFLGALFLAWSIIILAEVSIIAFAVGVPLFLIILVGWVFQVPRSGRALCATFIALLFVVYAIGILARLSVMALVIAIPLVIALLVAWVLLGSGADRSDSEVPYESVTD